MKRQQVVFSTTFQDIKPINDEFYIGKCWVCALGKNRNMSYISKEAADDAQDSLWNIPIVGHLFVDKNGEYHMGGHDTILSREGNYLEYKPVTVPFGVVPYMPDQIAYEEVEEDDGEVKTYITCPVIIWGGRYPEVMKSLNQKDASWNQSMEISVSDAQPLETDSEYYEILKYQYSALCMLGRSDDDDFNVEPCFPEAKITLADFSIDDNQFNELFAQLKTELANCFKSNEGGSDMEETIVNQDELVSETEQAEEVAETSEPELDVNADEPVENEVSEVQETSEEVPTDDVVETDEPSESAEFQQETNDAENVEDSKSDLAFTAWKTREQAIEELFPVVETDTQCIWYEVCDFTETHIYVKAHYYNIENDTCGHQFYKYEYTYNEEEKFASLIGEPMECVVAWLSPAEAEEIARIREERDELITYKANKELEEKQASYDKALEAFEDLAGNEEYESILANKYSYSNVDELMNACYVVRGKFGLMANKKTYNPEPMIQLDKHNTTPMSKRELLHATFGKK